MIFQLIQKLAEKIKPLTFFVFAAIAFEIVFNYVTPPFQAPDELNHFYRTYQLADGHFLPERTPNRLGGELPACFDEFTMPYFFASTNIKYVLYGQELSDANDVVLNDSIKVFKDFPNTAYYSVVSYAPQALAVFIVKQFNCKVSTLYYAGRFGGFIFWFIIMALVIHIVPIYKWLFTLVILLPMNLYIANSLSADTVTNGLSLLFIALILKHTFSENKITTKNLLLLLALIVLIALAKVVYIGAIALLLIIPAKKFGSKIHRYASIGIISVVSLIVVYLWSGLIMKYYIRWADYDPEHNFFIGGLSDCADYHAQKAYILSHGTYFLSVIYHTIVDHPTFTLNGYIGYFGQSDIRLPGMIYVIAYGVILFIALTEANKHRFNVRQKLFLFAAAAASFLLLLTSQHLLWDCVGEGVVDLLQGRYLIPVFPLLFLMFSNSKIRLNYKPVFIVVPFILVLNAYSARKIHYRFHVETYTSKTEFVCDFEKVDQNGNFVTTDSSITLSGGTNQVTGDGFFSYHCAYLPPPSKYNQQYGFNYKFKNLDFNDMVEIEAWQKNGQGATLVLQGKGKDCEFFLPGRPYVTSGINGWFKICNIFTMTKKCDSADVNFFIWNPTPDTVRIDHLKFRIKKYNYSY